MHQRDYEQAIRNRPMVPVRIVAHLAAPLCSRDGHVHLDAVLSFAAMHMLHWPGHHRPAAATSRTVLHDPPPLPLHQLDGVAACSCLWPDVADRARQAWRMRPALEYAHLAMPNQIRVDSGPTRLRQEQITIWPSPTLTAHAIGEPRLVERLLRGVPSVGHKRSQGYGRVQAWEIVEDDAATMLWRVREDGSAARPLLDTMGIRMGVRPPYWYRPWWQPAIGPGERVGKASWAA